MTQIYELQEKLEAQKKTEDSLIDVEIRRRSNLELIGHKFGARLPVRTILFSVSQPSESQMLSALRESGSLDYVFPSTQSKQFEVSWELDIATNLARQVARVTEADLWTIVRDSSFRRAVGYLPKKPQELTFRDIGLLESVAKYWKIKEELLGNGELNGLIKADLVVVTKNPSKPLSITPQGRQWLNERKNA